jgi:tetratricopeptide (TPR) repeat protein
MSQLTLLKNENIQAESIVTTLNKASDYFFKLPRFQRMNYQASIKFLTNYQQESFANSSQQVKVSLEAIYHLCSIPQWPSLLHLLKQILNFSIAPNYPQIDLFLPLSEYLLFHGDYQLLLKVTEEIIQLFPHINDIKLLQARVLASLNQNPTQVFQLLEEIAHNSHPQCLEHIQANSHLAMYQVGLGNYKEGMINLQNCLTQIDKFLHNQDLLESASRLKEIKTDILEVFAYYEMNASNFDTSLHLYDQVIKERISLKLIHKTINPQVHQGIICRRKRDYIQGITLLQDAEKKAIQLNNINSQAFINHHLSYIYLNQGNIIKAEELAQIALTGYQKLDDFRGISDCYEQLGFIDLAQNKYELATQNFELSLQIRQKINNHHGVASCWLDLSLASWHKKKFFKAIFLLCKGFYSYSKIGILNKVRFWRMLKLAYTWSVGKKNETM